MRIRSIKPEFWRSPDVADLSIEDRLLWIGLWSYVDDNGVGKDHAPIIAADLFAFDLSRDAPDTLARVSRGLQHLSASGRITRYTLDGDDWLYVNNWSRHQRIDRPNKPRYPLPTSDDAEIRESVASVSRDPRETPSTGTEEQGNRGTDTNAQPAVAREPSRFPEWWAIWGKKKAKGDARKAYSAAVPKKISHDALMVKTRAYWEHVKRTGMDPQYVPYPATWLRGEQWDDDMTGPAQRPNLNPLTDW